LFDDDDILNAAREGFIEEARDMLAQLEQGLLALEADPADAEAMNVAFRAAHTIKGTAGLFGYDAVVAFTHEAESLLDAMRSGDVGLSDPIMAALLQSRDQIGQLMAEVDQAAGDPAVAETSRVLGQTLRALRGEGGQAGAGAGAAAADAADADAEADADAGDAASGLWHLSIRMGQDALRNGLDPLSFIRYLDRFGSVTGIRTLQRVPDLATLDPEDCHLGFEIRYRSDADRARIEQVFEFLAEDASIRILAPDAAPEDYEALLAEREAGGDGRDGLLSLWQALAGPGERPFIERRKADPDTDRRSSAVDDRRTGTADRRAGHAGGGEDARFVRVRADKLDHLIDLIGELVIASSGAELVARTEQSPRFSEVALRIHDLVQEARDGALGLRMVPIGETFARFHRVVRDVSKQLGKDVELQISGGDTELDKSMVETIADPLMHLVRNSLDHGVESPAVREAAGKPAQGRLGLHAYHESGSIVIEVSDDGKGLDRDRILAKAIEKGLIAPDLELTDEQVYPLIFLPGFSTAEAVTNLSGRGVGMDVVKSNVESLRGQITVASQPGRGATMQIRLPLTLAMIDGFLTSVGPVSYVLPLAVVAECIDVPAECRSQPERTCGTFDLRGEVLPYVDMSLFYGHAPAGGRRSLVVVRDGPTRIGLVVDRLHGEHQTVIKPLSPIFRHLKAVSGSTILGSGEVALVLDVQGLMQHATRAVAASRSLPRAAGTGVAAPSHGHPQA